MDVTQTGHPCKAAQLITVFGIGTRDLCLVLQSRRCKLETTRDLICRTLPFLSIVSPLSSFAALSLRLIFSPTYMKTEAAIYRSEAIREDTISGGFDSDSDLMFLASTGLNEIVLAHVLTD